GFHAEGWEGGPPLTGRPGRAKDPSSWLGVCASRAVWTRRRERPRSTASLSKEFQRSSWRGREVTGRDGPRRPRSQRPRRLRARDGRGRSRRHFQGRARGQHVPLPLPRETGGALFSNRGRSHRAPRASRAGVRGLGLVSCAPAPGRSLPPAPAARRGGTARTPGRGVSEPPGAGAAAAGEEVGRRRPAARGGAGFRPRRSRENGSRKGRWPQFPRYSISNMPDVEEKVPLQNPGDAESGACEPETSVPTQGDKSGPEDHPPLWRARSRRQCTMPFGTILRSNCQLLPQTSAVLLNF
uniref:T-complex 11 n=1 Tax=Equus asinus TaxID=9793 RepID=A0A9L0IMT6_EQUAS